MPDETNEEHIHFITQLGYITGQLSDDEVAAVEIHFAHCDDCIRHTRGLKYLREHFDEVLNSWTPEEYGRVHGLANLDKTLESLYSADESERVAGQQELTSVFEENKLPEHILELEGILSARIAQVPKDKMDIVKAVVDDVKAMYR